MLPQELKSPAYRNLQPKNINKSSVQLIMAYDLAGWGTGDIADVMEMTQGRVSIIKNSPLYMATKNTRMKELQQQVVDGTVKEALKGDPVRELFKKEALSMAEIKIELAKGAKNEFVRANQATSNLEYAGYKPEVPEGHKASIEMTDKIADRFIRVLGFKDENKGITKLEMEMREHGT